MDRIGKLRLAVEGRDLNTGLEVRTDLGPRVTEYKASTSRTLEKAGVHPSDFGVMHGVEDNPGSAEGKSLGPPGDVLSGDGLGDAVEPRRSAIPRIAINVESDVIRNSGHHEQSVRVEISSHGDIALVAAPLLAI